MSAAAEPILFPTLSGMVDLARLDPDAITIEAMSYGPRELGDLWPEITNRLRDRVGSLLAPLQVQ